MMEKRIKIPDEILKTIKQSGRFQEGDTFKLRHTECTPDYKSPALSVTRKKMGWIFHCHRCGLSGWQSDNALSPDETTRKVKESAKTSIATTAPNIHLPEDFVRLRSFADNLDQVPTKAFGWLWKNGVYAKSLKKHTIGWSQSYNRLIFPMYDEIYGINKETLLAWAGRNVDKYPKVPKWITKSKEGSRRYYYIPSDINTIVIVEDVASAIAVHDCTKYATLGLLNSTVGTELFVRLHKFQKVYLWLDKDMYKKSFETCSRMRQLGINAKHVSTIEDPKKNTRDQIRKELEWTKPESLK